MKSSASNAAFIGYYLLQIHAEHFGSMYTPYTTLRKLRNFLWHINTYTQVNQPTWTR